MVWPLVAIAAVSAVQGIYSANQAGKAEEKAQSKRKQALKETNKENIRRTERQNKFTLGEARGMAFASGIRHSQGSSSGIYIADMQQEMSRQTDWMQKNLESEINMSQMQSDMTQRGYKSQQLSSAIGGLSSGMSTWWNMGGKVG